MLLNFVNFEAVSVKNSVGHEPESFSEYHEAASRSDVSVNYHVAVAENEVFGVGMHGEVVFCECDQLVVVAEPVGCLFAVAP